jgi:pSer/pThr/pTyr-binding forkhead associated (FHA) protein
MNVVRLAFVGPDGVLRSPSVPWEGRPLVLGRAGGADIRVAFPDVSARHAWITVAGAGTILEDLGSTNGTVVERGSREFTPPVALRVGDVIKLAGRALTVKQLPEQEDDDGGTIRVHAQPTVEHPVVLSPRRREVLEAFADREADGSRPTRRQVAERLGVSDQTVKSHLRALYLILDVPSVDGQMIDLMVEAAIRRGLLDPEG